LTSVFSGFYRLAVPDRLNALHESGVISAADFAALSSGDVTLERHIADHLIENVIGVAGLPFAVALNFVVNGRDRLIPLVVEEPSIVAALSAAAKACREAGGFEVESDPALMIGQIQLLDVADADEAEARLVRARDEIIAAADAVHPNLSARGGGVRDMQVLRYTRGNGDAMLVVHLLVDTCDAMGANLINTICEQVAPRVAAIANARAHLRILSNLADQALVRARMRVPLTALADSAEQARDVRDGIIAANEFALLDVHRATTHNKGIMNGIDAVVVATGNDWRAVEAGVHAWAARDGRYRALTRWSEDADGALLGELELPIKLGIVGGSVRLNPIAALSLRIAGIHRARELDELVCAVGLAQNFSAIKALATSGIQRGHMALHARSVAVEAGATPGEVDAIVDEMVAEGTVKAWRARELIEARRSAANVAPRELLGKTAAAGKVIIAGEHAVVYGFHAIGVPIEDALTARIYAGEEALTVSVPDWHLSYDSREAADQRAPLGMLIEVIREGLQHSLARGHIEVECRIPAAAGLGGSAALAVVLIRSFNLLYGLGLDNKAINALAYECEKLAHGMPSGVDNALSTYAEPIVYSPRESRRRQRIHIAAPLEFVVGFSSVKGVTSELVAGVAARRDRQPDVYGSLFQQIGAQTDQCLRAMETGDVRALGDAMNVCHGLLNAIGVSHPALEQMIAVARDAGALGAKLTGAGGGGSIVALCNGNAEAVVAALATAGFESRVIRLPASEAIDAIVSFDGEELILVDSDDQPTGFLSKLRAHDGDGVLHRAFSLFVFNRHGEVLLQRRAADKRLWGGYWSNSCCSHPRRGEEIGEAAGRRLEQELGISAELRFVYKFQYQARFGDLGSEHELCSVYVGRTEDAVTPNRTEVDDWKYVAPEQLDRLLESEPDQFTPWFKLEWRRLRGEFADQIADLTEPVQA
jgi:hydroxymethylglutaryl-CoA reductase